MVRASQQCPVVALLCVLIAAHTATAYPRVRGHGLLSKLHLHLRGGPPDLPANDLNVQKQTVKTSSTSATTFPPQPQLITLAPPVPTTTLDSSFAPSNTHGQDILHAGHWPDYNLPLEIDEAEPEQLDDADNHATNPDTPPLSSKERCHYNKRSGSGTRRLGRKGKAQPRTYGNTKQRDTEARNVNEDWRAWRSQFAQQQQWRRCRELRFGLCPGSEQDG